MLLAQLTNTTRYRNTAAHWLDRRPVEKSLRSIWRSDPTATLRMRFKTAGHRQGHSVQNGETLGKGATGLRACLASFHTVLTGLVFFGVGFAVIGTIFASLFAECCKRFHVLGLFRCQFHQCVGHGQHFIDAFSTLRHLLAFITRDQYLETVV